ncbi:hypothetical protein FLM48_14075 [Shewanella sp. Scap07]|uniref:hypothetical protein n=1 Tax=Shewanella sp. Scap07 TaxID=2589987 RepID=UPI0015B7C301|nr:hypothetical protein [Shewanella sp. Scap07]QLE86094.1 hypothetical protein FLM48_14075 [Shewanella sp. Scap07]
MFDKLKLCREFSVENKILIMLLLVPLLLHITTVFFLSIEIPIKHYVFSIACIIVIFLGRLMWGRDSYLITLITSLLLTLCLVFAIYIQDFNFDSRAYHLPASIQILEGWNPVKEIEAPVINLLQIESFPKGQWYVNAASIGFFDSIEAGKFTHVLYVFSCLFFLYFVCRKLGRGIFFSGFVSIVGALNPVALAQLGANHVDGPVGSLLTILLVGMYSQIRSKKTLEEFLIMIIASILLASIKTTALIYVCLFWFTFFCVDLFRTEQIKKHVITWCKLGLPLVAFVILINWNPYVTNTILKGNPIFPVLSETSILKRPYLDEVNRFESFLISHTSAPVMLSANSGSITEQWRSPYQWENIKNNYFNPTLGRTIGAFGPFWIVLFLVSLSCLIRSSFAFKSVIFFTLFITFIHSEGWHARYVPFLWAVAPLLMLESSFWKKSQYQYIFGFIATISLATFLVSWPSPVSKTKSYLNSFNLLMNESEIEDSHKINSFKSSYYDNSGILDRNFEFTEAKRIQYLRK